MAESREPQRASDRRPPSPYKGATGLHRIRNATRNSLAGLASAWRDEAAFRQELVSAAQPS